MTQNPALKDRWHPNVTVATIVERDNHFLMVEELIDGKAVFNQPAGHVEPGERIFDAALRETLEETGWEVTLDKFLGIYVLHLADSGSVYHRYCFSAAARVQHSGPQDSDILAAHWMTASDILDAEQQGRLRSQLVSQCLRDYQSGRRFPLDLIFES